MIGGEEIGAAIDDLIERLGFGRFVAPGKNSGSAAAIRPQAKACLLRSTATPLSSIARSSAVQRDRNKPVLPGESRA